MTKLNNMKLTILLLLVHVAESRIDAKYGLITIVNESNCTLSMGDHSIDGLGGGQVPGLWFGVVDYRCERTFGHILSKFECMPCGVYCTDNQMHVSCKTNGLALGIGLALGFTVCILIVYILRKRIGSIINRMIHEYHFRRVIKMDRLSLKKIQPLLEHGLIKDNTPIFNNALPLENLKHKDHEIIKKKVEDFIKSPQDEHQDKFFNESNMGKSNGLMKYFKNTVAEESSIKKQDAAREAKSKEGQVEEASTSGVSDDKTRVKPSWKCSDSMDEATIKGMHEEVMKEIHNNLKKNKKNPDRMKSLGLLVLGLSSLNTVDACDTTLFLSSKGRICKSDNCNDLDVTTFNIRQGDVVCFNTHDHGNIKIEVENTDDVYRYVKDYYTSDYELKADNYRKCWNAGECNWDACEHDTVGQRFKSLDTLKNGSIYGHGCNIVPTSCDWTCAAGQICHYYRWSLQAVGKLYPVYTLTEKTWSITIKITYNTYVFRHIFNVNSPTHKIVVENKEGNTIRIPMSIVSVLKSEKFEKFNLIETKKGMNTIRACEKNFPIQGIIGEYQISLDGNTRVFDTQNVDCSKTVCYINCIVRESAVSRFLKGEVDNSANYSYNKINVKDSFNIDVIKKSYSTINMMIGNIDIKNLIIKEAKCKLKVEMTYGCVSCTDKPIIVFSAYDIKAEGSLEYISNCTFDRQLLSCVDQPYMVMLDMNYDYCMIEVPTLNMTEIIKIEYEFLGSLSPIKYIASVSPTGWSTVKDIASSPEFLTSIIGSFTFFAVSTLILTTVIKVFRYVALVKTNKDLNSA